jgi:hypothetical protein
MRNRGDAGWFPPDRDLGTELDRPSAAIYQFRMARAASSATDESGSVLVAAEVVAATAAKEPVRGFLQSARRDLSDEELATPAARRFPIAELERLDQLCLDLKEYERQYNNQRVTIATLTESAKVSRWNEILSFVSLSIGSAGIGAAPSYLALKDGATIGLMVLAFSIVLVLTGIASRVRR